MARLTLYKRGPRWWVSGSIDGTRYRESTGHTDRGEAESWALRRETEIVTEGHYGPASVITFGAGVAMYLEGGKSAQFITPIFIEWERRLMKDIHPGDVIDLANRLYPNASGATKNRQVLTPVMAIFRFCAQRGKCAPIIVKRFETKKVQQRTTATWPWMAQFTASAKPKLAALALFLATTAARIDDALRLEWSRVDLAKGLAILIDTKNGEDRIVTLLPEVVEALRQVKRVKGDPRVFQFYDRSDVARQIKTACKKAGIPYVPTHGIGRRLFATTMNASGIDPVTAAKAGGWKSVRMYQEIYAQSGDVEQAVARAIGTSVTQTLSVTPKKARQNKGDKA